MNVHVTAPVQLYEGAPSVDRNELSRNVFDEVEPYESVITTVNVVDASAAVGVPVIAPVFVPKDMPAGSVPGGVSAKL